MKPSDDPAAALSKLRIDRSPTRVRRPRRWGWWLLAVLLAAGALAWWLTPRVHPVRVVAVIASYPSQQYAELTASGYVVAQRRAAVASKATGRLVWLGVREGSQVSKGDVIARIDASDVRAKLAVARAAIGQADAAIAQALATGEQARVELANARAELGRALELVARGFVSSQAADAARLRADRAQASVTGSVAGVASARAGLAQARAQLQVQQVEFDSTEIRAPFDGVVLVKNANVGDMITPFSQAAGSQGAVVTIADMGTLEVEADVSESNVARIRAEQPVEISLDAIPGARFRGSVARIVPTVDRAKATVTTKIRFETIDPRILPEMAARATFLSRAVDASESQPLIAVHPEAVVERDGRRVLLRLADRDGTQRLEAVPVVVGRKLNDAVEISGDVRVGDRVVLAPEPGIGPGSRVRVAEK